MARVKVFGVLCGLGLAVPALADPLDRWRSEIALASERCGVPSGWIERVMRAESNGETVIEGRPIRSRAGAIGLMQLMPGTWEDMRLLHGLGQDPDDPSDNIIAGSCYLRHLHDRFGYPGLFAAYNAGPARFAHHLETGSPLPGETLAYLDKVVGRYRVPPRRGSAAPVQRLFAVTRDGEKGGGMSPAPHAGSSLFAVRNHVR